MGTNAFECPRCHRVTRHVQVSQLELASAKKQNAIFKVGGALFDVCGLTKGIGALTGWKSWKCVECGLVNQRSASGEINECWNESFWNGW